MDGDGDVDGADLALLAEGLGGLSGAEAGMAVLEGDASGLSAVESFSIDYGHADCRVRGP